eukprot:SM000003S11139  [mRNA]  locus=s3:1236280:1238284:+ [translate_table: standard]
MRGFLERTLHWAEARASLVLLPASWAAAVNGGGGGGAKAALLPPQRAALGLGGVGSCVGIGGGGGDEGEAEGEDRVPEHVVVAVTLSEKGQQAVAWALGAARPGDSITVLHIMDHIPGAWKRPVNRAREGELRFYKEQIGRACSELVFVIDSLCKERQLSATMRISQGSCVRQRIVDEAIALGATKLVLGVSSVRESSAVDFFVRSMPRFSTIHFVRDGKLKCRRVGQAPMSLWFPIVSRAHASQEANDDSQPLELVLSDRRSIAAPVVTSMAEWLVKHAAAAAARKGAVAAENEVAVAPMAAAFPAVPKAKVPSLDVSELHRPLLAEESPSCHSPSISFTLAPKRMLAASPFYSSPSSSGSQSPSSVLGSNHSTLEAASSPSVAAAGDNLVVQGNRLKRAFKEVGVMHGPAEEMWALDNLGRSDSLPMHVDTAADTCGWPLQLQDVQACVALGKAS